MSRRFHEIKANPPVLGSDGVAAVTPEQLTAALSAYSQHLGTYNHMVQTLDEATRPGTAADKALREDLAASARDEDRLWQEYYSLAKRYIAAGGNLHLALFGAHSDPLAKPYPQSYAHLKPEHVKGLGGFLEAHRASLVCFPMIKGGEVRDSYRTDLPRRFYALKVLDEAARQEGALFFTTLLARMVLPPNPAHGYSLIIYVSAFQLKDPLTPLFTQDQIEFGRRA